MAYKTKAERKQEALKTMVHTLFYFDKLEFCPANAEARRIIDDCIYLMEHNLNWAEVS
jgi:hypothetical protein